MHFSNLDIVLKEQDLQPFEENILLIMVYEVAGISIRSRTVETIKNANIS